MLTIDGEVNVVEWNGTDVASPDTAGYPVVKKAAPKASAPATTDDTAGSGQSVVKKAPVKKAPSKKTGPKGRRGIRLKIEDE